MCFGKALGGGVIAMSAFFSTAEIWKCMEPNPFMHTTTTGGNPVACAAALAQITVLLDEDLAGQAAEKGEYIKKKVLALQKKYPTVLSGIQGRGLLLGMVFPSDEIGYQVASGLFSRGVLTAGTLNNAKTIRLEPALNIPYALIDKMLQRLEETFADLRRA
jgi:putrescine aminotransferase